MTRPIPDNAPRCGMGAALTPGPRQGAALLPRSGCCDLFCGWRGRTAPVMRRTHQASDTRCADDADSIPAISQPNGRGARLSRSGGRTDQWPAAGDPAECAERCVVFPSISAWVRKVLGGGVSPGEWCLGPESNQRHADFQSAALPTELPRRPAGARTRPQEGGFYPRVEQLSIAEAPRRRCAGWFRKP